MTLFNSLLGPSGIAAGMPEIYNPNTIAPTPRQFIYMFYFLSIHTDGIEPPLVLDNNSYTDYNNFVFGGVLPQTDQFVYVSDDTASIQVTKSLNEVEVIVQVIDRPLPSSYDPAYCNGTVEVWARYLDANGNIPASRLIEAVQKNNLLTTGIGPGFSFGGGNPGNRTYSGILQPNGFYKSLFTISLPTLNSNDFTLPTAQLYLKAKLHPYSVPPSANIIT